MIRTPSMKDYPQIPFLLLLAFSLLLHLVIGVDIMLLGDTYSRCLNIAPGVCCKVPHSSNPRSRFWGVDLDIFGNLVTEDIAVAWKQIVHTDEYNLSDQRPCGTTILETKPGPGEVVFGSDSTPTRCSFNSFTGGRPIKVMGIGGASYISLNGIGMPPDQTKALRLFLQGILGLSCGGGNWFASQAAKGVVQRMVGKGVRRPKTKRGMVSC